MRVQRRRFVVEVKRGTNRAAFVSQDPVADKFTSAEQALFGARPPSPPAPDPITEAAPVVAPQPVLEAPKPSSSGRILPDLQAPVVEPVFEEPPRPRRGRKPGSKNKPKPVATVPVPVEAQRPVVQPVPVARPALEQPSVETLGTPSASPVTTHTAPALSPVRLRDRSRILRRYVLGTEALAGQAGYKRRRLRKGE